MRDQILARFANARTPGIVHQIRREPDGTLTELKLFLKPVESSRRELVPMSCNATPFLVVNSQS